MALAPELIEKTCSKCGEAKRGSEFYRAPTGRDGLRSECKVCSVAVVMARRAVQRAEMGDEAFLTRQRITVARSRARTGNKTGRAYAAARNRAITALIERHRREFDHLLLLAQRGELSETA